VIIFSNALSPSSMSFAYNGWHDTRRATVKIRPERWEWAVLENADFRANDLVAFVRNVVLRIVSQSSAMQRLGG
jgi:hypothetical protein